jgi:hypothetical protein
MFVVDHNVTIDMPPKIQNEGLDKMVTLDGFEIIHSMKMVAHLAGTSCRHIS